MHLIGWEQAFDPRKAIDAALTESESGLYYQGAHPLLTLNNIEAIMPDDFGYQYAEWSAAESYAAGDVRRYNGTLWQAMSNNTGEEPQAGSAAWRPYNLLSDYLERLTRQGIATMVQTFVQMKGLQHESRMLLERRTFFDGAGRLNATQANTHKIVGFEISPARAMGVTAKVERVGLQMTGATGTVRLYLFHSSQVEPVKKFEVEFTQRNGGFQWFTLKDCYLPYISDDTGAGGAWFLCYNQDELPEGMQAVNVSKDWSREPCGTCNMGNLQTWRELTKYLQISPFRRKAPTTFAEFPEMWDIATTEYTNTCNYGLNVEVSVGCDLTDFIIQQRGIFSTVLQRQVAAIALRQMAMNADVRVNRNQSNASRMDILYELDGNTESVRGNGLGYELRKAYEALSLDTRGIDRICLACHNGGVNYTTV